MKQQLVPPADTGSRIYWGWFVVAGAFTLMVMTYGIRYSFGVFVKPMAVEYGWSRTVIQLGSSINLVMYALSCIITGRLIDRFNVKWIIVCGILTTASGLVLSGFITTPLGYYLTYGVLVGFGSAGCGTVVSSVTVGRWFIRHRGLAIGIAAMGIGVGTMVLAPLIGYIVQNFDWRTGFLFLGVMMLGVGMTVALTLMRQTSPDQIGLLPDGKPLVEDADRADDRLEQLERPSLRPVLVSPGFWMLVFCSILVGVAIQMIFNCQIDFAINRGIDGLVAASVVGVIGISGSVGKLFFGWLCDRIHDVRITISIGYLVMTVGMVLLYYTRSSGMLYIFALFFGFGYGSLAPTWPYIIADWFGARVFGAAYGLFTFFVAAFGASSGPVIGGAIFDHTGSYDMAWLLCIGIMLFVTFLNLFLKKPELPNSKAL